MSWLTVATIDYAYELIGSTRAICAGDRKQGAIDRAVVRLTVGLTDHSRNFIILGHLKRSFLYFSFMPFFVQLGSHSLKLLILIIHL